MNVLFFFVWMFNNFYFYFHFNLFLNFYFILISTFVFIITLNFLNHFYILLPTRFGFDVIINISDYISSSIIKSVFYCHYFGAVLLSVSEMEVVHQIANLSENSTFRNTWMGKIT